MEHKHGVYDSDTRFIINPINRQIKKDDQKKVILMQFDHNSERFSFELPRYIEEHDMSLCNEVEVHYLNASKDNKTKKSGLYTVDDLQISPDDPEKVVCSWLISRNATQVAGKLAFLLRFKCVEDGVITYAWNTDSNNTISISDGIDAADEFEAEYVDVIAQWKEALQIEFAQWHENTVAEMEADITAWKETESGKVRGEMTAFSGQWNQALATERARIDKIVALEDVAQKAIVKKRPYYANKNLTRIVQKVVGVSVDGLCGTKTDAAIRAYQKKHSLSADGAVGFNTWKKILNIR